MILTRTVIVSDKMAGRIFESIDLIKALRVTFRRIFVVSLNLFGV